MKLLILEYATAQGIEDPSITIEGRAMLNCLLEDFNNDSTSFLISTNSLPLEEGLCNPLKISGTIEDWLEENISYYDACLPLAPEEDFILYQLTKIIEKKGLKVVGSLATGVMTCSNKWNTYEALQDVCPIIDTQKIFFTEIGELPELTQKKVVKPADGVSCSGVSVINSKEELLSVVNEIRSMTALPFFLLQDYLEGISASVSLLSDGKTALPMSLNLQEVYLQNTSINYNGGKIPLKHSLLPEAFFIAKKAVESIKGLQGYVGVDVILNEKVQVVEINPRITTPYIALRKLVDFNLGQAILDATQGVLPDVVKLEGEALFSKENNQMNLMVTR
ncbi:MAG TPA: ATP-grasp domain-containing protein [Methanobacteriaceae archaeon]|nr:ATP-grasp domain-containing protein [Methanobacteriaceae archaeon]